MHKYQKQPVVIEARQFDAPEGATPIINWILENGGTCRYHDVEDTVYPQSLHIDTLEGTIRASVGDWVIKGVEGEFYPCKPDIFAKTYLKIAE